MNGGRRQTIDWAAWSTRRVIGVAVLYGFVMGCAFGLIQALVDHSSLRDAGELLAFNLGLWWVIAIAGLFGIRWLARHPRGRRPVPRNRRRR